MSDPTVTDALAGLKAGLLTINGPASVGTRVWAMPADRASIQYSTFPFIICAQVWVENGLWRSSAQGVGFYSWPAEILICLGNWTSRDDVSAEQEATAQQWLKPLAQVIFGNRGLGGAALALGTDEAILTTSIGNIGWIPPLEFFGVYAKTMVHQVQSLPSI